MVELTPARVADVNGMAVRRALPHRTRRTVGPWCFVDQFGPQDVDETNPVEIGPHPHIGLQTVTWLVQGTQLHRDSLGSEQLIRPGQLNLMTSGAGITHSEQSMDYRGQFLGAQMWVALPEATRHGQPAFEHHAHLPEYEIDQVVASVLVGAFGDQRSPARADTDLVGIDLHARPGRSTLPLRPDFEYAVVVLDGALLIDDDVIGTGALAYLGEGREEVSIDVTGTTRALLLGGTPFESPIVMWWNFVGRSRDEIAAARQDWVRHDQDRFGNLQAGIPRVAAPEFATMR